MSSKEHKQILSNRDFHGEEFYKWVIHEYEEIRHRKKSRKGRPDNYEMINVELDKMFESTFKTIL